MKLLKFLDILFPFFRKNRNIELYHDFLKERPEDVPKIKQFGIKSIIRSILSVIFAIGCVLVLFLCLNSKNVFWMIFGTAILIYLIIIIPIVCNIKAIILWVLQLKCNKKAIGWVALAVWILCTIGSVFIPIIVIRAL